MKPKALATMRKRGRPTLAESAVNPYSKENMTETLRKNGLSFNDLTKIAAYALKEIEKPEDKIKAVGTLMAGTLPFVAKKLGNESEAEAPKMVINIKNFNQAPGEQLKDITPKDIIDV